MTSMKNLNFVERLVLGRVFKSASTGGFGSLVKRVYEGMKGVKTLIGTSLGLLAAAGAYYGAPPEFVTGVGSAGVVLALMLGIPDKGTWLKPTLSPEYQAAVSYIGSAITYLQWSIVAVSRLSGWLGWSSTQFAETTEMGIMLLSSITGFLATYADPVATKAEEKSVNAQDK